MSKLFLRSCAILMLTPIVALASGATTGQAAAVRATGTSLYVSTSGSDTNACTRAAACATLQHAVDIAPSGATINVEAGKYHQTVNMTKPLSLIGAGAGRTTIDGSYIDTGAGQGTGSSTPYYGVVSVQNNVGVGGATEIKGFTIAHAFVYHQRI